MAQIEDLLDSRYYREGENKWGDIAVRVTNFLFPDGERYAWDAYPALYRKEFIPSSPVLMNAGSEFPMMCSCFVLPIYDDIDEIMRALHETVRIQKYGGGVGLNFSPIRPEGSNISTTGGQASGPVSFMKFWNAAMEVIRQAGKRQGALMGVLNWQHPDIDRFLAAKQAEGILSNFNLSVGLDHKFWSALSRGEEKAESIMGKIATAAWNNGEPGVLFLDRINEESPYDRYIKGTNPCTSGDTEVLTIYGPVEFEILAKLGQDVEVATKTAAGDIVYRLMKNPRQTGVKKLWEVELSTGKVLNFTGNHKLILEDGTKKQVQNLESGDTFSVMWGEQPVSCESVEPTDTQAPVYNGTVDKTHKYFVRAGETDAILSANCGEVPLPPYGACCLGSVNLKKCLTYGIAKESVEFDWLKLESTVRTGMNILDRVIAKSWWPVKEIKEFEMENWPIGLGVMGLADTLALLGIPYADRAGVNMASEIMEVIREVADDEADRMSERYNHPRSKTVLSIAPTGSIAMLADCSYSIEPYFTLSGHKEVEQGTFVIDNKILERVANMVGFEIDDEDRKIIAETGSVRDTSLLNHVKRVFKTANEIPPQQHIAMQAAIQEYVDNSVSKTINLPHSTTIEEIVKYIQLAWSKGCKGLTLYRTGSRKDEVISCPSGVCDIL